MITMIAVSTGLSLALGLAASGLDTTYWLGILKEDINCTDVDTLRQNQEEVLAIIGKNARDEWEELMLKDFLGLKDESINRDAIAKETWEKRKATLHKVLNKNKAGSSSSDGWGQKYLLSGSELLEQASGGLALTGILFTENENDCLIPRGCALKVKPDVEVCGIPDCSEYTGYVDLGSASMENKFYRILHALGYHAADSLSGHAWGFYENANLTDEHQGQHPSLDAIEKTLIFTATPIIGCVLNSSTVNLSPNAVAELKSINKEFQWNSQASVVQERCEAFFSKYGTHVNYGMVEFGEIRVDGESGKKAKDVQGESPSKRTQSMPSVISRGLSFQEDYKPIWELIQSCHEIPNSDGLCYMLRKTWRNMFSSPSSYLLTEGEAKINAIIREIGSSMKYSATNLEEKVMGYLQELRVAVNQPQCEVRNQKYWVDVLKYEKPVSDLLAAIADGPAGMQHIQNEVKQLVSLAGSEEFPMKDRISVWLASTYV